jgi:hypothetical protein
LFDAARRARCVDESGRPSPRLILSAAARKAGQERRALSCAAGAQPRAGSPVFFTGEASMASTCLLTRLSTVAGVLADLVQGSSDRPVNVASSLYVLFLVWEVGVANEPRGARRGARNIASHSCIRLDPSRVRTKKQSYASAARLRGGGPVLGDGTEADILVGLPPPRIVIGDRSC